MITSLSFGFLLNQKRKMFALRIVNYNTILMHVQGNSRNFKLEIYFKLVPDKFIMSAGSKHKQTQIPHEKYLTPRGPKNPMF